MRCVGTSLLLKKEFGVGYTLTIMKSVECTIAQEDLLQQKVTSCVPNSSVISNVSLEIRFKIPFEATSVLSECLSDLENNSINYGIHSFSMSLTTLEEVFLKVGTTVSGVTGLTQLESLNERVSLTKRRSLGQTDARYSLAGSTSSSQRLTTVNEEQAFKKAPETPVESLNSNGGALVPLLEANCQDTKSDLNLGDNKHDFSLDVYRSKCKIGVYPTWENRRERKRASWPRQFMALLIKRSIGDWRDPGNLLWRLVEGPLYIVIALLILQYTTPLAQLQFIEPVQILAEYPYAKTVPHTLYFGFSSSVGPPFRDQFSKIMNQCNPETWRPILLPDIHSRNEMDKFLAADRSKNIYEERSGFHRSYISIFFDADTTESQPYPIFIHDSAFVYSLSAAMSGYTDCIARYSTSLSQKFKDDLFINGSAALVNIEQPTISYSSRLIASRLLTQRQLDFLTSFLIWFFVVQCIAMEPVSIF